MVQPLLFRERSIARGWPWLWLRRYATRLPAIHALDQLGFRAGEEYSIRRNEELQFRAEAFNLANHMVLGVPGTSIAPSYSSGNISYGSAGVVTGIANTPRELQLALKFLF